MKTDHSPIVAVSQPSAPHARQKVWSPNRLAGAQLAGLAQLGLAVHAHLAVDDHGSRLTAAVGQAGGLEQGIERNVVATQLKVDLVHRPDCARGRAQRLPWRACQAWTAAIAAPTWPSGSMLACTASTRPGGSIT